MDKALKEMAKARREKYEGKIKEICQVCNSTIEKARKEFLMKRRDARHIRDEAITAARRE